jgi:hypothetical protein
MYEKNERHSLLMRQRVLLREKYGWKKGQGYPKSKTNRDGGRGRDEAVNSEAESSCPYKVGRSAEKAAGN